MFIKPVPIIAAKLRKSQRNFAFSLSDDKRLEAEAVNLTDALAK